MHGVRMLHARKQEPWRLVGLHCILVSVSLWTIVRSCRESSWFP